MDVIRNSGEYEQLQRVSSKLKAFSDLIDELVNISKDPSVALHELYDIMLEKTGYIDYLKTDKDAGESRIENVKELLSNIKKYEEENPDGDLSGFLEEVSLLTDIDNYDENSDSIVMMTLHSSKGLEFPTVFIPGFEEGIFPGMQSLSSEVEVEEERRLAYVGITRSKDSLYILNSDSSMIFGSTSHNKSSRFLSEMPQELLDRTKSRDWKKLDNEEDRPKSAQEIRNQSLIAAHHFGQVAGGGDTEKSQKFEPGLTVVHKTFGQGTVMSVLPMNGDSLLEILFDKVGSKKLMANYAHLKIE